MRVGILPHGLAQSTISERRRALADIADAGIDHIGTGDHVSFFGGWGDDGLVRAASLLSLHDTLPVHVGVYLLPLRHPVPVARQVTTIADFAPGRLVLGVGIGGEDPHELEVCGIDPRTRGRRTNESLAILRDLLSGRPVTTRGEFYSLRDAVILPTPDPRVPIVVGGRSDAALKRTAELGDGWLAIWVSPRRFAEAVEQIGAQADSAGRSGVGWQHALQAWCGIAGSRKEARAVLAPAMEGLYRTPFERFERYSPAGTPEDIAEFLRPYADAGCTTFNLIARSSDTATAVRGVAEVKRLLAGERRAKNV